MFSPKQKVWDELSREEQRGVKNAAIDAIGLQLDALFNNHPDVDVVASKKVGYHRVSISVGGRVSIPDWTTGSPFRVFRVKDNNFFTPRKTLTIQSSGDKVLFSRGPRKDLLYPIDLFVAKVVELVGTALGEWATHQKEIAKGRERDAEILTQMNKAAQLDPNASLFRAHSCYSSASRRRFRLKEEWAEKVQMRSFSNEVFVDDRSFQQEYFGKETVDVKLELVCHKDFAMMLVGAWAVAAQQEFERREAIQREKQQQVDALEKKKRGKAAKKTSTA